MATHLEAYCHTDQFGSTYCKTKLKRVGWQCQWCEHCIKKTFAFHSDCGYGDSDWVDFDCDEFVEISKKDYDTIKEKTNYENLKLIRKKK